MLLCFLMGQLVSSFVWITCTYATILQKNRKKKITFYSELWYNSFLKVYANVLSVGHSLDILSRAPLWNDGLDYRHGTGHGIGSYLNVHEGCASDWFYCLFFIQLATHNDKWFSPFAPGPHLISFRPSARNVPLQASMTVTDGQWIIQAQHTFY
jgi:hypothetical protein